MIGVIGCFFWWFWNEKPVPLPVCPHQTNQETVQEQMTEEQALQILIQLGLQAIPAHQQKEVLSSIANQKIQYASSFQQSSQSVSIQNVFSSSPVILHIWGTWCPPCRREIKELDVVLPQLKTGPSPISCICVTNRDDSVETVTQFLRDHKLQSVNVGVDIHNGIIASFQIHSFPQTFLFHANGQLVGRIIGTFPWQEPGVIEAIRILLRAKTSVTTP